MEVSISVSFSIQIIKTLTTSWRIYNLVGYQDKVFMTKVKLDVATELQHSENCLEFKELLLILFFLDDTAETNHFLAAYSADICKSKSNECTDISKAIKHLFVVCGKL